MVPKVRIKQTLLNICCCFNTSSYANHSDTTKAVSHTHKSGISSKISKKTQTKEVTKTHKPKCNFHCSLQESSHDILGIYYKTYMKFLK